MKLAYGHGAFHYKKLSLIYKYNHTVLKQIKVYSNTHTHSYVYNYYDRHFKFILNLLAKHLPAAHYC